MSNRLGTWQAGQLYENFKSRLKEYTEDVITPESFLDILNMNVDEYVSLAGLLDSEEYKDSLVLSDGDYAFGGFWAANSDIVWTASTKNLYVPNANFTANFTTGFTNFNTTNPIGARILIFLNVSTPEIPGNATVEMVVTEVIDANNVRVSSAPPGGDFLADGEYPGALIMPGGFNSINIGSLSIYKNIDRIIMINSSSFGECIYKPLPEFKNITDPTKYPIFSSFRNKIIYTRLGELLEFRKGNLASYGTRTMHYVRTPYHCSLITDLVDLRNGNINIVQDNNILDGLQTLKVPIPNDLATAQARRQEMRSAKSEELTKNFERKE